MRSCIPFLLILLAAFIPTHADNQAEAAVDENSLGQVVRRTREMYESGVDKRWIAEWVTKVCDERVFSSNKAEALTRPFWASLQVHYGRNDPSNSGEYNDIANSAWSRQYGNCEENSALAYYILKKAGVKENVRVLRTKKHSFCVWDMPANAQSDDPSTWGDGLIVDPWLGEVLDGPEASINKWFKNGEPANEINDVTKDIDLLADSWQLIQKREEHRTGEKIIDETEEEFVEDCFIATAVYGTPLNAEIQILRDFRENELRTHLPGRMFIAGYERFGPCAAYYIRKKEERKQWALKHIVTPALEYAKQENKLP